MSGNFDAHFLFDPPYIDNSVFWSKKHPAFRHPSGGEGAAYFCFYWDICE